MTTDNMMTLYPPAGDPLNYPNVTDVEHEGPMVTFYTDKGASSRIVQKIRTTLPFTYVEAIR